MATINEQVLKLYEDGVLLADIHEALKLPVKSIVDIIFNARSKTTTSPNMLNKKTNWYIYFCEFMYENKSLKDIVVGRTLTVDECVEMIGNVIKLDTVPKSTREDALDKIAKEIGETPSDLAKRLGVPYSKTFATAIKKLWR